MKIRLADMSVKRPIGILENINVRIGRFSFPTDFVVIDMEEDLDVLIILRRPFLNTAKVLIDDFSKTIAFRSGGETLTFTLKPSDSEEEQLCAIYSSKQIPSKYPEEFIDIEMDTILSSPKPPSLSEIMELSEHSSTISDELNFIDIPMDDQDTPVPQTPEELFPPMTNISDMITFIEMFKDHPEVIVEVIQKYPLEYTLSVQEMANDIEIETDEE